MALGLTISLLNIDAKEISKVFLGKEDRLPGISSGGEMINCSLTNLLQSSND